MKFSLFVCLFVTAISTAQTKNITLEDIWKDGTFRTERMDVLHSMANGQQYSVLNFDRESRSTSIDIYDYKTLKKVSTLVNSEGLEEIPYFTDYTFSQDEQQVILATNEKAIYRRSALGNYYVYNVKRGDLDLISEDKIIKSFFTTNVNIIAKASFGFGDVNACVIFKKYTE